MMKNFWRALVLLALLPTVAAAQTSVQSVDLGKRTDAAVTGDANGTLIGHIRYLDKALADVWDLTAHANKIKIVKADGSDVAYLASVTEAATETGGGTLQPTSSYLKLYDGSNWKRAKGATTGEVYIIPTATNSSATFDADIVCQNSKIYDASTSGNTELVAISGSKNIFICGYEVLTAGTVNVSLVAGTGTACASAASGTPSTGTSGASASLTPAWVFTAGSTTTGKLSSYPTHGWLLATGTANALCIKTSGAVAVQAQVFYSQR